MAAEIGLNMNIFAF